MNAKLKTAAIALACAALGTGCAEIHNHSASTASTHAELRMRSALNLGDRTWTGLIPHAVRRGDTVYSIARQYGSDPDAIARANRLGPDYQIRSGEVIDVPVGKGGAR
ncbi:MAG: LysM domain-containing protein [Pseudomonadota bacterium]